MIKYIAKLMEMWADAKESHISSAIPLTDEISNTKWNEVQKKLNWLTEN